MNKKLALLLFSAVMTIVFMGYEYAQFAHFMDKSREIENHLRTKQIISQDINRKIMEIRALYYKILNVLDKQRALDNNIHRLKIIIGQVENGIEVLSAGGIYEKKVSINVPELENYSSKYHYTAPEISTEMIGMMPKIILLKQKTEYLKNLALKARRTVKGNHGDAPVHKDIALFVKSIDSIFRRMLEDSNKIFYRTQVKLLQIEEIIKKETLQYNFYMIGALLIFLIIFLIGIHLFVRTLWRRLYLDRLTMLYSRVKLEETYFNHDSLLLLIDIDDFSDVNALYSIETGDKLLQCVAGVIQGIDSHAQVFRVASDIFAIYYPYHSNSIKKIREKVNMIQAQLHTKFRCQRVCDIDVTVTIGAAHGKKCLHDAFMALDIANTKKEAYRVFDNEIAYKNEIEYNKIWYRELNIALQNNNMLPFFQPIVDAKKQIFCHESLMRMKRDIENEIEYVSPLSYLDVAIRTKQYIPISHMVIEKTFQTYKDPESGAFSINLSYEDIERKSTWKFLEKMVDSYDVSGRITFEVLESSSIKHHDTIRAFIDLFRAKGAKFAIDDFGSGYSNAKRVVELDPDYIKIDGELIKNMLSDNRSYKMVENIVSYAKEFGINTVAEHVSSQEIFDACIALGVDYFQGYLFSEPVKKPFSAKSFLR